MDGIGTKFIFQNWTQKLLAVVSALVLWLFVNNTITESKTIPNVPIRIVNLPPNKTISGLLPNRILSKRIALTLSGTKDVIQQIEPGDLEVLLDVSMADSDDWIVHIGKKNLISLNPSINLAHHITQVDHNEFVLKLSPLVTAKIPINILPPTGEPPAGYEFLDIWPQKLIQTVSGPEDEISKLKTEGLDLEFNLSNITKNTLDGLKPNYIGGSESEISYYIPEEWKKIEIPISNNAIEEINDPEAQQLRIDFLRKSYLPLDVNLPIRVFYPLKYGEKINPETYPLATNEFIQEKNRIKFFSQNTHVKDVSALFLNLIKDNLGIVIIAAPKTERNILHWGLEIVDQNELEDLYVALMLSGNKQSAQASPSAVKKQSTLLRKRFREYASRLRIYYAPDKKIRLESILEDNKIRVILAK